MTDTMNITQLLLWCMENNFELLIKPATDSLMIRMEIKKKANGYLYGEVIEVTIDVLKLSKLSDQGCVNLIGLEERITRSIERPVIPHEVYEQSKQKFNNQ